MGRSPKKGLEFFKKSTYFYDDDRIIDLIDEYGPLGVTVYDIILTLVYKNGYYLELDVEKLCKLIKRTIGNKWIKENDRVLQVIDYCADIGLFDLALRKQNIITSVGIQKRYAEICARNKVDKSKYWLLDDFQEASTIDAQIEISVTEKPISVTEKLISVTEMQQEKEEDKIRLDMFNSYCCTNAENNNEDNEDDFTEPLNLFSAEEVTKLKNSCDKIIFDYWSRRAKDYDYKQAARMIFTLQSGSRNISRELTDELLNLLSEAVEIAAAANSTKWSYVQGIIRNWKKAEIMTMEQLYKYQLQNDKKHKRK